MQNELVSVSFTKKYWVSVSSTCQILMNALFVKHLLKEITIILVLYIDFQAKMLMSVKFSVKF